MTSTEMKRALDLLVEYIRTGTLCVSAGEMKLMREYIRAMANKREVTK